MHDHAFAPEPTHRQIFGNRVRYLRQIRNMSQERLAQASGLHRTYISSLERGRRNVSLDAIFALADALGVGAAELFIDGDPHG